MVWLVTICWLLTIWIQLEGLHWMICLEWAASRRVEGGAGGGGGGWGAAAWKPPVAVVTETGPCMVAKDCDLGTWIMVWPCSFTIVICWDLWDC